MSTTQGRRGTGQSLAVRPGHILVVRTWVAIAVTWLLVAVIWASLVFYHGLLVWAIAFIFGGIARARFAVLTHEAAHGLVVPGNRRWNDLVGRWIVGAPAGLPYDSYRTGHLEHHGRPMSGGDPDASFLRDIGNRGSLMMAILHSLGSPRTWAPARWVNMVMARASHADLVRIAVVQLALLGAFMVVTPWAYLVAWIAPWCTWWRIAGRLRTAAEHGARDGSHDARRSTNLVRQSAPARLLLVPLHSGWHLSHHANPRVPWYLLPRFEEGLLASGWLDARSSWPSYRALWRALESGVALSPRGHEE